jgi:hypothetical protein
VASEERLSSIKSVSYVFVFGFVLLLFFWFPETRKTATSAQKSHRKHFHIGNQKDNNVSQKTHGKHFHIGQQK